VSRRLPLCAWCGEPLQGTTMELQYDRLPGCPAVGWHVDTCDVAETERVFFGRSGVSVEPALRAIDARGPGRVVAGKAWRDE
jgi:hypothetical protein